MNNNTPQSRRSFKLRIFVITSLILTLLLVKAVMFFTARPKPAVDYLKALNDLANPSSRDPNENAAPGILLAMMDTNDFPQYLDQYVEWPADLNSAHRAALNDWLDKHQPAFNHLRSASRKKYYAAQYFSPEPNLISVQVPMLNEFRHCCDALLWNVKNAAAGNDFKRAFDDIETSCRIAILHFSRPSFNFEQRIAVQQFSNALDAGFCILDRADVSASELAAFQAMLTSLDRQNNFYADLTAEKFMLYDLIQLTFVNDRHDRGRLAFNHYKDFWCMCGMDDLENLRSLAAVFIGPTSGQMKKKISDRFELYDSIKTTPPYDLHLTRPETYDHMDLRGASDFFFRFYSVDISPAYLNHFSLKTRLQGLITTTAILRFRSDRNRLPQDLNELMQTGYITSIPRDPFGPGPLTYKLTDTGFTLYSWSSNFIDDNAQKPKYPAISALVPLLRLPDLVLWPVETKHRPDSNLPPHRPNFNARYARRHARYDAP